MRIASDVMTLPSDSLRKKLLEWTSDEQHQRARALRISLETNRELAEHEATFAGLLLDVSERGDAVRIETTYGKTHHGPVEVIGRDFCAINVDSGIVIVATRTVRSVSIESQTRRPPVPSARTISEQAAGLADILAELAVDRVRIRYVLEGDNASRSGELAGAGEQLCTIATNSTGTIAYIPVAHFCEVALT
jgi:hypothetical protein